jgi:predicted TIM-barrel fold metal-dependent hydrolase
MEERKAFGDFVVDHLCGLAAKHDIPVQMHLGTAIIRGSHPLNAAGLIERHPRTRFLLMHLAFPWSRDLLGMAFVYRNIWIDLTWSWLLGPSHFKQALHEAIETLPDESRMMLGGDNWHVEETYGAMKLARKLIGEVLEEKVTANYLRAVDVERIAHKIFRTNGVEFFKLA